jgi:hypothetical protein
MLVAAKQLAEVQQAKQDINKRFRTRGLGEAVNVLGQSPFGHPGAKMSKR